MMPSSLAALIVAWSVVLSPDAAPVPPAPQPTFNLGVAQPNYNETCRRYDMCVYGNFQNVPTQLQIRFVVRRTDLADATKFTDFANPECVQCWAPQFPAPFGQDAALTIYHRVITSAVRLVLHDRQLPAGAGGQLMHGVDSLARLCHAVDTKRWFAWAYLKFSAPLAEGQLRDVPKTEDGGFTGFASLRTYEPAKYKYTLKTEFWSGPVRLATFADPDGEVWIPIPLR